METVASLIREFPFGSFLIISAIIAGGVKVAHAFINRNKPEAPKCECECCEDDEDDDDEGEGPAIMGGSEED